MGGDRIRIAMYNYKDYVLSGFMQDLVFDRYASIPTKLCIWSAEFCYFFESRLTSLSFYQRTLYYVIGFNSNVKIILGDSPYPLALRHTMLNKNSTYMTNIVILMTAVYGHCTKIKSAAATVTSRRREQ